MKTKVPNLITILVLTVLTSVLWISLGVYRAITTKPTPSVPEEVSQPLTPTLDKNTIDDIKNRQFIAPSEFTTTLINTSTPFPSETPIPIATSSATPSANPEASPSATPGGITP